MMDLITPKTPGQLVKEAMEAKGWNQSDLAFALGTTTAAINQILSDKRGISHNMARTLGAALDQPASTFARVQAEWDVQRADEPDPTVSARARVLPHNSRREIMQCG